MPNTFQIELRPSSRIVKSKACFILESGGNTVSGDERGGGMKDGEKPFACKQCKYSCTTATQHKMLTHSGEKHFICKQCIYSCTTAGDLKKHMWTHSGEKLSDAHSVNSPAHQPVASKSTCSPIREKSLSVAHNVTSPAQTLVT